MMDREAVFFSMRVYREEAEEGEGGRGCMDIRFLPSLSLKDQQVGIYYPHNQEVHAGQRSDTTDHPVT